MARTDPASDRLRALLAASRNVDGGWPYYAGRKSRLEPTAWALLALGDAAAAALLNGWRSAHGLLIEPGIGSVNYGFNAIAALALASLQSAGGSEEGGAGVARALLAHRGERLEKHPAIRQNPDLQGWSWTDGTFSWVEPTAWCTLAVKKLARTAPGATARIDEAEKVLADRACDGGGWNTGNPEVYGQALPAYVPPTAVGVLALQDHARETIVVEALGFLTRQASREGSTTALALSWMASAALNTAADLLVSKLVERLPLTESIGNVPAAAMMLYAVEQHNSRTPPKALML